MIALRLVHLIETHADTIARNVVKRVLLSPRTRDMRKIPESELLTRTCELLNHLGEWLLTRTAADVEARYRELGARRAEQCIGLASTCWALTVTKAYLREFVQKQGIALGPLELYGEMELLCLLDKFFDRAVCHVIEGYERSAPIKATKRCPEECAEINLAAFVP